MSSTGALEQRGDAAAASRELQRLADRWRLALELVRAVLFVGIVIIAALVGESVMESVLVAAFPVFGLALAARWARRALPRWRARRRWLPQLVAKHGVTEDDILANSAALEPRPRATSYWH